MVSSPDFRKHISGLFSFAGNENLNDGRFNFTNCIFLRECGKYSKGDSIWNIALNFELRIVEVKENEDLPETKIEMPWNMLFSEHLGLYN